LIAMALWIGIYPKPFFQILEQPVNQIVLTIHNNSNVNAPTNAHTTPHGLKPTVVDASSGTARALLYPNPTYPSSSQAVAPKASN
jgi:hypothetical protein